MSNQDSAVFPAGAAFVTGGSGGVGSAISQALAAAGTDVALTYNRNKDKAEETARAVRDLGRKATIHQVDLEKTSEVRSAIEAAVSEHGQLHTAVYAAGPWVPFKFMSKVEPEEFKSFLLSDIFACYNLVHASLPHLRVSRGSLVAITTTAVDRWAPQDGLSAIPKAAIDRLMVGIAREEGRYGVRANSVALGVIEIGMHLEALKTGMIDERYMKAMTAAVPLQRRGKPQEVANAVVFLASSLAGYTTGQTLRVDGGYPT